MKRIFLCLTIAIIAYMLLQAVVEMPLYGAGNNPAHNYVIKYYIEQGLEKTGAVNIITQIILDFRGYDTLIETTVLYTAITAVLLTLKGTGVKEDTEPKHRGTLAGAPGEGRDDE